MVLKVLADTGQVFDHFDAMFIQLCGRTNTGQHQQSRRVDGAGR